MSAIPAESMELDADIFFGRVTRICREIGGMVANVETALIDAAQMEEKSSVPRKPLQKMDMVIQSLEELALLIERVKSEIPSSLDFDWETTITPTRLEWMRRLITDGAVIEDNSTKDDDISLF